MDWPALVSNGTGIAIKRCRTGAHDMLYHQLAFTCGTPWLMCIIFRVYGLGLKINPKTLNPNQDDSYLVQSLFRNLEGTARKRIGIGWGNASPHSEDCGTIGVGDCIP